jgi:hypothetical protein
MPACLPGCNTHHEYHMVYKTAGGSPGVIRARDFRARPLPPLLDGTTAVYIQRPYSRGPRPPVRDGATRPHRGSAAARPARRPPVRRGHPAGRAARWTIPDGGRRAAEHGGGGSATRADGPARANADHSSTAAAQLAQPHFDHWPVHRAGSAALAGRDEGGVSDLLRAALQWAGGRLRRPRRQARVAAFFQPRRGARVA